MVQRSIGDADLTKHLRRPGTVASPSPSSGGHPACPAPTPTPSEWAAASPAAISCGNRTRTLRQTCWPTSTSHQSRMEMLWQSDFVSPRDGCRYNNPAPSGAANVKMHIAVWIITPITTPGSWALPSRRRRNWPSPSGRSAGEPARRTRTSRYSRRSRGTTWRREAGGTAKSGWRGN